MNPTRAVMLRGDGEPHGSTRDVIQALIRADDASPIEADSYSLGGTVEKLEDEFARRFGKEAAIFVPSGTLANHLAVRRHCAQRRRCLIQEQSHLYQDCGDCVQILSGINLVPIAMNRAQMTLDDVVGAFSMSLGGRVRSSIGALVIESPDRRQAGQIVSHKNIVEITDWCREHGIKTHLDGARLYMMSAATGIAPSQYASYFDSVYVSLYKYFGAPYGAILAGTAEFVDGMFHDRRMFGGGLASSALAAALALHGVRGFEERLDRAFTRAHEAFTRINQFSGVTLQPFECGSNIWPLRIDPSIDQGVFLRKLHEQDVELQVDPMYSEFIPVAINTTILRQSPDELAAAFASAIA